LTAPVGAELARLAAHPIEMGRPRRRGLDHPLIIQTIRLDRSGSIWIDDASNLSRPDPSGANQIDGEHQATDLTVRVGMKPRMALSMTLVTLVFIPSKGVAMNLRISPEQRTAICWNRG
jgi:hypothetical protein